MTAIISGLDFSGFARSHLHHAPNPTAASSIRTATKSMARPERDDDVFAMMISPLISRDALAQRELRAPLARRG
jgi:hypothetical protein